MGNKGHYKDHNTNPEQNLNYDPYPVYPDQAMPQQMFSPAQTGMVDIDSVIRSIDNELKNNIAEFSHLLIGEQKVVTQEKGRYIESFVKTNRSIVNDVGRWSIIAYISSCATAWSDIKEREVRFESGEITERFIKDLYMNMEKWGVEFQDLSALVMMVEKFIEYKIIRKVSEKKVWDVVQRTVSEHHQSSDFEQRKKGFSLFGR